MPEFYPQSATMKNLEAAFASESMAHAIYLYFAGLARANGHFEVAKVFEETADQELKHSLAHAQLLYPQALVDTRRALEIAIEAETYEYSEMYPGFYRAAVKEGNASAQREHHARMQEPREHVNLFLATLDLAAKRFTAMARIKEKHAEQYRRALSNVDG